MKLMDGPVNSDVSYFRDTDSIVGYPVNQGIICHRCGSGEVYTPGQTMALPMIERCLNCGTVEAAKNFNQIEGGKRE